MPEPIIQFDSFSFKYRAQAEKTLTDINLSIYKGEKVLIVGASGSGKSTIGHCINALIPGSFTGDSEGLVVVDGKNPSKDGIFAMSSSVGTVLQDSDSQFVGLTVGEDIAFSMENDLVPQDQMFDRVNHCAKLVGMEDFLKHAPQALSGGQKQRVALAGVMSQDVKILLFDEPLANLDPATGKYAIELIDEIKTRTDTTVIIIEHRLEDVLHRPVDRIVLIDDGRIIADEKPDRMLSGDLLIKYGVREPLYLSAIKYAGCEVNESDRPSAFETMPVSLYKDKVLAWHSKQLFPEEKIADDRILEVKNCFFCYNPAEKVLSDVSFSVRRGEMLSIVGKNGSGKSTLSNLICGFLKPDSGDFLLNGASMQKLSISKRAEKIGYVMQNPNQMISKTFIFDEVAMGLRTRGVPEEEIKQRVADTLEICGLKPFMSWPISALSYGQKKRVTIASILVLQPELIILDEPTAGQDFHHYTEIMKFLERINKEMGITIIIITHDMHLMLEYTQRAVVLCQGKVLADQKCSEVLTDESITAAANLKLTSLYYLALACGIDDKESFVDKFIKFERGRHHA